MASGERPQPVTMADVAARAGVSRALVSIVLRGVPGASPASRERVLRAAAELDYHPDQRARLLGAGRSRTLGVVHDLHQPFHGELVEALYAALPAGWGLTLEPAARARPEAAAVRALLNHRCEAVLLVGPSLPRAALAELAARTPVVVLARAVRGVDVDVVRTDDEAGARLAVEHLLSLGHRRTAHLHGGRAAGAAERRAGYRAAVRAAGLEPELLPGGLGDEDGVRAAPQLLRAGGPTAVLAFNDACAAGVLAAARRAGAQVPGRLSLVGYDDSAVAALSTVALTTVGQDAAALAAHAVRRATARAEEPGLPTAELVSAPRLVVRATTARP
ncbi:LacI family DNA-binding transcriptional regulator [Kineococcus indalonis]|uniref:LacI family DNA-binding transcriptional regulator n=1 Tax=Kineococcus indalonis TaxID=2696566 RepID=UPI001411D768|nr:substrate-binding domain-containing protein [Kineococcus indalonis]